MSNPISDALNDFVYDLQNGSYREYIQRQLDIIHVEAQKKALQDVIKEVEIQFNALFKSAVKNFYDSYALGTYSRNESLYNIFKFENNGESFTTEFDEFAMSQFERGAAGGLYELTFKQGYHGGAPAPDGNMRYRVPYELWYQWGDIAFKSSSPYEFWYSKAAEYWNTASSSAFNKLYNKYFNQMLGKLS